MSPHHSDQMSQWSQVSRIALCMSKVKVSESVSEWVSESVSEWQGHLLSCSGQLKTTLYVECLRFVLSENQYSLPLCEKGGWDYHSKADTQKSDSCFMNTSRGNWEFFMAKKVCQPWTFQNWSRELKSLWRWRWILLGRNSPIVTPATLPDMWAR